MTTAKVRIEGEDATAAAWASAIERAKGAADQMGRLFQFSLAGLSLGGIAELGNSALEYGAQFERASQTTRASTESLQALGYAAKQLAGADLPTVVTALTFMDKALSEAGSGMGEQKKALDALGLTYAQIKDLAPDKQFELIGDRISKMTDPTDRARAAADLLGRSWQELGPVFANGAAGIDKLTNEARNLGLVLSDEQIKRLNEAHDSVDRLTTSFGRLWDTLVANTLGEFAPVMSELTGALNGDKLMRLQAQLQMAQEALTVRGGHNAGYESYIKDLEAQIAKLQGQQSAANGAPGGLGEAQVSVQRIGAPPGFQHVDPADALQPVATTVARVQVDALQKLFAQFSKDTETDLERQTEAFLRKMDELGELAQQGMGRGEYLTRTSAALDALPYDEQVDQLGQLLANHSISMQEHGDLLAGQGEKQMTDEAEAPDFSDSFEKGTDKMQAIAEQAGRNIQNAFAKFLFDPFKGGVRGMAESFLQAMQKMLANEASEKLFSAIGNWGNNNSGAGGLVGGLASFIGGMFGGGKASGGDVDSGTTYLVGENGPELFTPSAHGVVTPNAEIGGTVHIETGDTHIHFHGDNSSADEIRRVLPDLLAAHGARTKAEILDAFRRSKIPAPYRA